jgi:hypothetical protein
MRLALISALTILLLGCGAESRTDSGAEYEFIAASGLLLNKKTGEVRVCTRPLAKNGYCSETQRGT